MDDVDPTLWQPLLDLDEVLNWGERGVRVLRLLGAELGWHYQAHNSDARPVTHLCEQVAEGLLSWQQAAEYCYAYSGTWAVANHSLGPPENLPRVIRKSCWLSPSIFPPEFVLPLLRCIVGNPFRPVVFDPAWRTEHTVGLAARMYDAREFAAMPILADALEEAGCDSADVLSHCREPGPHARGCWVVDGVLGKR